MARHNIYIRKEDEMLWNSVIDIPSFIHEALISQNKPLLRPRLDARVINKGDDDYQFCKHDAVKGYCKQGCK